MKLEHQSVVCARLLMCALAEEEEEEEEEEGFNDTIEGPRAPAVKPGRVTQACFLLFTFRRERGKLPCLRWYYNPTLLVLAVWTLLRSRSCPASVLGTNWCRRSRRSPPPSYQTERERELC